MNTARPLDNFPLIRSHRIEELQEAFARVYAEPVVLPPRNTGSLDAVFNNCRLQRIELAYLGFSGPLSFAFPGAAFFSLLLPMRGTGEIVSGKTRCTLGVGAGAVLSAGIAHHGHYPGAYENTVLRISARTLTEKLQAMTGATIGDPLRMQPQAPAREPAAQMLRLYVPRLIATLSQSHPPFPQWWIEETEQILMLLFLFGYQHNYSHLLESEVDAAPWQVRRAEEYIAANVERAVTLDELAEVTGVSGLSLFRTFKQCRGYSPLEFVRRLRGRQRCRS